MPDISASDELIGLLARLAQFSIHGCVRLRSTDTLRKQTTELGGNAPFSGFDDADIEQAVKEFVAAKLRNSR